MDFKFVSHGLWSEEKNILLQHVHKKEFWILTNKCGNKLKHENEAKGPMQRFHLEGNFLPKGNIGLWKDRNKEMQCGRKSEGNLVIWMESGRKFQNS
jgi:hypothetical protein